MQSSDLIRQFIREGISILDRLGESDIVGMIQLANQVYYNNNGVDLMTDNQYDILLEYARKRFPANHALRGVGATPIVKNKVVLPYNMPSMDKIKPDTGALDRWTNKYRGPYVLSCKLDGVSGMFVMGPTNKLYTRGDGKVGQDIGHFIGRIGSRFPSLGSVGAGVVGGGDKVVVRGEFVIPKSVFDAKYRGQFANARNLVSGIINSKTIDDKVRDVHFIAYEVITPSMPVSQQMQLLEEMGFEVVQHKVVDRLSNDYLSQLLLEWRSSSEVDIDGVIVSDNGVYARGEGNPEHAFAFKMVISDQVAEATVVDVLWEPSKSGYLKPRVQIEPIVLGGVTIQYATGFNGAFIESNRIGVGAVIEVVRSGDVIPHIRGVVRGAECGKMPSCGYVWTKNHVDVVLENVDEDETVRRKNITEFFKVLEVDGLSGKTVERLMEAGYDSVPKILRMSKDQYMGVRGFKDVLATKIYEGVRRCVEKATLVDVMVASGKFGRGIAKRKIDPILAGNLRFPCDPSLNHAGNLLLYFNPSLDKNDFEAKYRQLLEIKGVGCEVARGFVNGIGGFLEFLKECGLEGKLNSSGVVDNSVSGVGVDSVGVVDRSHVFYGKNVVVTKVKNPEVKKKIKEVGGILQERVGKDTDYLVVQSLEDVSNKIKAAKEKGVRIVVAGDLGW